MNFGNYFLLFCFSLVPVSALADTWEYCPAATESGYYLVDNECSDSLRKLTDSAGYNVPDIVGASLVGGVFWFGLDKIDPLVDFGSSCTSHDICYATPGAAKRSCDSEFKENMKASCKSKYPSKIIKEKECRKIGLAFGLGYYLSCKVVSKHVPNPLREHCNALAEVYYQAVSETGIAKSEFRKLQGDADAAAQICDNNDQDYDLFGVVASGSSPVNDSPAESKKIINIGMTCDWSGYCNEAFGRACSSAGGTTGPDTWGNMACFAK